MVNNKNLFDYRCWINNAGECSKVSFVETLFDCHVDDSFVLLDDYSINLHEWERGNGRGIKLRNGVNGTTGTWVGHEVTRFEVPSRPHRSLISATGKTTVVQKASSLQSMKTKTISTLWFVAGMAMIIRLKAAIRLLKKTRKDVNGQFSHD